MTNAGPATTVPRWQLVADRLEREVAGPTAEQLDIADRLGIYLPELLPVPVAAVLIRKSLEAELRLMFRVAREIPRVLGDIEDELGVARTERLHTGTREELSAWFESRYILKTVRGLRALRPQVGDVVVSGGWKAGERRVISTIHDSGRVFMKLRPPRSAWPNNLEVIERVGSPGYAAAFRSAGESLLDSTVSFSTNLDNFLPLARFELENHVPEPEAIRALEELLESGEQREEPLQQVLTQHPELLASTVVGGWKTFVIPKPRLGSEYVPDFLVLGINSVGPQWVTIEIEGARHKILTKQGRLAQQTRHALDQVEDWREWLARNVSYAQMERGFHGLTSRAPGLVIIGRDDPVAERQASRARSEESARIAVHSWDWLLRGARNLTGNTLYKTRFAADNLNEQVGRQVVSLPASSASTFDEILDDLDQEEFNRMPW
ncbi:DUF4263 domain-containing protein [Plantibacter sp. CFBP 8798]|uniref:Shedu anti-phage system protein SduA domain-containing protein n=1 Tax=Plantibacter sp. CFBP 8798 TaxID=2775268 RepID=UPI0017861637|nr:Shedu anti-phage system protein SduA domain-containing protein [Plantibacter sp. CFBP 8798]MBD8467067.1 DUF4263 domain-containing protein [Plantibacter sp. CFBP 8798]